MKRLIVLLVSVMTAALLFGVSFAGDTGMKDSTYSPELLIGLNVDDIEGHHVGIIRGVNLDTESGEINYFTLGRSLLFESEDILIAVSPEALQIQDEEGTLTATLVVSEPRLLEAPAMAEGESVEDFRDRLQNYYCASPELDRGREGLKQC